MGFALLQLLKVFDKWQRPVLPSSVKRRACTCISAYDETLRKEPEAAVLCRAVPGRKCAVYITCSGYWRVRPGRAVSLCLRHGAASNGTDNGEADTGRQHVCKAGDKREEGKEEEMREGRERRKGGTVPPRLSLSAGFTWIGLFICDRDRKRRRTNNRKER